VDAACSRAIIIDNGKIVANGTPDELKQKTKSGRLDDLFRELTMTETKVKEAA
jgi:ABC-2 type transport system ATP-binding protein